MEDINRLCVFSFHKKTGEGVAISFVEMKGEKMRISLKEQRSGSDSEYEEITAFTVNVDNAFYGSVARNSHRGNSYIVPVSHDNNASTKQHLVFDFSFSSNQPNKVQFILTTRYVDKDPVILINENILSKNDSVRELCMFLELYVIPNAEISYHLRPEVE